jgi:hypothetical protein
MRRRQERSRAVAVRHHRRRIAKELQRPHQQSLRGVGPRVLSRDRCRHHAWRALDLALAQVDGGAALPPSGRIATTPRAAGEPLAAKHLGAWF